MNTKKQNSYKLLKYFGVGLLLLSFSACHAHAAGPFQYQLLEAFPGFFSAGASTDLPTLILDIYKFGIWTVGIAGLFMLTIGGFMYMSSAGNTATASKAKGVIEDAIIGIIAAMCAYLILYVINPDLTKINLSLIAVNPVSAPSFGGTTGTGGAAGSAGNGSCQTAPEGSPCAVDSPLMACFGSNVTAASEICMGESGGIENISFSKDNCQPSGPIASYGLFQINITANAVGSLNCPSAIGPMFTAQNHNCAVKNQAVFGQCVSAAKTAASNIATACALSSGGTNWGPWAYYKKQCGL